MELSDELPAGVLAAGERILLRVRATGPQPRAIAWLLSTSRRVTLTFTSERLLCVRKSEKGEILSISEIPWSAIAHADIGRISNRLVMAYRNGGKEVFTISGRADATAAREVLDAHVGRGAAVRGARGRRPLCPACFVRVPMRVHRCAACNTVFRNPRSAVRFALWWPGGGYFFLRRTTAAWLSVTFELLLLILLRMNWQFHALGNVANPWPGTLLVVLIWCTWKAATAMHVAAAARELIIDDAPATRYKQIPPLVVAEAARDAAEAGVAAVTATIRAGAQLQQRVSVASAQLTSSPQYERAIYALEAAGPAPFIASELSSEERAALAEEQRGLVAAVQDALAPLLEPGEDVRYATRAAMPYTLLDYQADILLLYFLRRCVCVFTDRRMFVVRVGPDDRPLPSVSAVRYSDVLSYDFAGGFGFTVNMKLKLVYHSGRKETFNRIPLADLEQLRATLPELFAAVPSSAPASAAHRERRHFCVWCASPLTPRLYACGTCGGTYRDRGTAIARAVILPGGGYFYLRMPKLGTLDALIESLLMLNILGLLVSVYHDGVGFARAAMVLFAILIIQKVVSIRHAVEHVSEFVPDTAGTLKESLLPTATRRWRALNAIVVLLGAITIAAAYAKWVELYPLHAKIASASIRLDAAAQTLHDRYDEHEALVAETTSLQTQMIKARRSGEIIGEERQYGGPAISIVDFADADSQARYEHLRAAFWKAHHKRRQLERSYPAVVRVFEEVHAEAQALDQQLGGTWLLFHAQSAPDNVPKELAATAK